MRRSMVALVTAVAVAVAGCGSSKSNANGGAMREVLVDYKHDSFDSSFLRYYPRNVIVHPGDTVNFRQAWTGEPHSVTMGTVIDKYVTFVNLFEKYDSEEAARAGGVSEETIKDVITTGSKMPPMIGPGDDIFQAGAQPCFVADVADIPAFSDEHDETIPGVKCPAGGHKQPAFTGKQALYNSGFIPFQGTKANTFEVPIAKDAVPGTYTYFCNYHWISMRGTVKIVPKGTDIPSRQVVTRQARKEIEQEAKHALAAVRKAGAGDKSQPLAGLSTGREEDAVLINEFAPGRLRAKVGQPVTWKIAGAFHTVSFNVPKYFPVFSVAKSGQVRRDPKSYKAVGWTVPEREHSQEGPPKPRLVDVGKWDGSGGYRSSGALAPDETFTLRFTKPGTYPFACVVHPPMIGRITVTE